MTPNMKSFIRQSTSVTSHPAPRNKVSNQRKVYEGMLQLWRKKYDWTVSSRQSPLNKLRKKFYKSMLHEELLITRTSYKKIAHTKSFCYILSFVIKNLNFTCFSYFGCWLVRFPTRVTTGIYILCIKSRGEDIVTLVKYDVL